jgi:hypothetical protein
VTEQIPDPGQHLVRYYGWYASRTRGWRHAANHAAPAEPAAAAARSAAAVRPRDKMPYRSDAPADPRDRPLALSPLPCPGVADS